MTAVYGNTDGLELRSRLPQVATLQLDGFDIVVTHGDQLGSPTPAKLHAAFPRAEVELPRARGACMRDCRFPRRAGGEAGMRESSSRRALKHHTVDSPAPVVRPPHKERYSGSLTSAS